MQQRKFSANRSATSSSPLSMPNSSKTQKDSNPRPNSSRTTGQGPNYTGSRPPSGAPPSVYRRAPTPTPFLLTRPEHRNDVRASAISLTGAPASTDVPAHSAIAGEVGGAVVAQGMGASAPPGGRWKVTLLLSKAWRCTADGSARFAYKYTPLFRENLAQRKSMLTNSDTLLGALPTTPLGACPSSMLHGSVRCRIGRTCLMVMLTAAFDVSQDQPATQEFF